MGHHGFGSGGHHAAASYGLLAGMPRGLKIVLLLLVLFLVLLAVGAAILVALVLLKLLTGGALPAFLQNVLDFARQNLQPLLTLWNSVQGLAGK